MKRRFFALFLVMLLSITSIAGADSYILHKPDKNQLQENEALETAREFLLDLTGVEITGVFKVVNGMKVKGKVEAFFGPDTSGAQIQTRIAGYWSFRMTRPLFGLGS